ncbi:hypothetical protein C5688_06495 [Methylocystis sp. MitZ-2018]|nr:hypothetical protein C5688_06495 [Methylocystis sp. MitZ-2018]
MGLELIAEIMGWDDEDGTATREYAWLRLMARIKYDGYADFRAGVRFIETLATWLKQFDQADRTTAYAFVQNRLVYISPAEQQRLIEAFVPEIVTPNLRAIVAAEMKIKPYEVWSTAEGAKRCQQVLRKTLFVGMSDGSRIDVLRRANAKRVSTEQVVPMMNVDYEKWKDLDEKLREDGSPGERPKFDSVYLIDDFTASGTTFIRNIDGNWKGKLKTFNDIISDARLRLKDEFPINENYDLHIHHYVSSRQARTNLDQLIGEATRLWDQRTFGSTRITEGLLLPADLPLHEPQDAKMLDLCERYYNHSLFERLEKHCHQARQTDMKLGYANCALPVVLDHNTPNNSIPLLWAETNGSGHGRRPMQPLFYRRDRHG